MTMLGVVVIGRNEGERLKACLESIAVQRYPIVYVDSGSTDGSPEYAETLGAVVVALDLLIPFTAARARNEGFHRLMQMHPRTTFVQFVDGDCVVCPGWMEAAVQFLECHSDYAVVCGQVTERFRDASIYNRLMAMEWNTPCGDANACGGIFAIRVSAFEAVNGFTPAIVAGEEPELCVRLRQKGWRIRRMPNPMVLHDAAMNRFGQWWKRTKRGGYAYAYGAHLHGKPPERHWVRETRSAVTWGLLLPILISVLAVMTKGWGLLLLALYPVQAIRIARYRKGRGDPPGDRWLYGVFCILGKVPEALGVVKFHWERWMGKQAKIIEYKGLQASSLEHDV